MKHLQRTTAIVVAVLFAMAGMVMTAGSASAHSTTVNGSSACVDGVPTITWTVTNSESNKVLTVTSSDDDAVPTGTTVGTSSTGRYPQAVQGAGDYRLDIAVSWPGDVTADPAAKVVHVDSGCTPPAPVDVCETLPGNQPDGTPCSHEPEVTVTPQHEESCALGGANDWTRTTTVSYVFDEGTNTFEAQPAVVSESTKQFTAWTEAELLAHSCSVVTPPVVVPPVVTPPVVEPPVVVPPVVAPPVVEPPVVEPPAVQTESSSTPSAATVLPDTGASSSLVALALLGALCVAAGAFSIRAGLRNR